MKNYLSKYKENFLEMPSNSLYTLGDQYLLWHERTKNLHLELKAQLFFVYLFVFRN